MTVGTTSLRVRPNMLALYIRDEFGNTIMKRTFQESPQLAEKLTYFELVQLHRANPLLFSQRLYHNQNITPLQLEHWKRFTKPGTSEMWPGKGELAPVAPVHDPDPFAPIPNRPPEPIPNPPPEIPEPVLDVPPEIPEPIPDPDPEEDAQQLFIEADESENQLVYAPPGTGKTHALIERLVRLSGPDSIDQDLKILVLSFSRAAVRALRQRLSERLRTEGRSFRRPIDINTFDSFASQLMLFDFDSREFLTDSHDQTIRRFVEGLRNGDFEEGELELSRYSHLFVDEIQDLTSERADMVLEISKILLQRHRSVTGLGDWGQAIYDWRARQWRRQAGMQGDWNIRVRFASDFRSDFEALLNYYGVKYKRFTRFWRYDNPELKAIAHSAATAIGSYGDRVTLYRFREEVRRLELVQPVQIAQLFEQCEGLVILARRRAEQFKLRQFFLEQEIPAEIYHGREQPWPAWISELFSTFQNDVMSNQRLRERSAANRLDYDAVVELLDSQGLVNDRGVVNVAELGNVVLNGSPDPALRAKQQKVIRISTIHKAKGLEYPDVVVLEPDWQKIGDETDPEHARTLYVAITRGTRSVKLLSNRRFEIHSRYVNNYPLTRDGRGIYVDGIIETIDPDTLLQEIHGGPISRETLQTRRAAIWSCEAGRKLQVQIPEGAARYWLTAPDTAPEGAWIPICAVNNDLDRTIRQLRHHQHRSVYVADLDAPVTVGFSRNDNVPNALLGPARVALAPFLSGVVRPKPGE